MIEFERTKKLSKSKKLSLREVNDKAHLGTNSIYNWKTKKPGSDALAAVAKVLNTTTDYLKGLTDNPNLPSDDAPGIEWSDLGMAYGGKIPKDLERMYKAIVQQYVKDHPESVKKDDDD